MKSIKVENSHGLPTISFADLKAHYELNGLKENKNRDVGDLKRLILKKGFKYPLYIWTQGKYVTDGTGRIMALGLLEYEGYEIPDIPYISIIAKDRAEAKEETIAVSSRWGEITEGSFKEHVIDIGEGVDLGIYDVGLNLDKIDFSPKPLKEEKKKERGIAKSKIVHKCPNCHHEFSSSEE